MTNAPAVVWQHGPYRVVAVDAASADDLPVLVMERRFRDALGGESWMQVCFHDDNIEAAVLLMAQVASRIDVLPPWVRKFVREDMEEFAQDDEGEAGDAS